MSDLFTKHSLWESNVKIKGIDGGIDSCNEPDDDDGDSDEDSEEASGQEKDELPPSEESHDVLEECSANDVDKIAVDIDNISKCNLIDSTVKEHFRECLKSFKRLPSATIPMYECTENQNKKFRKHTKQFSAFLEVKALNNETVCIRKSTALWLLQEGERVSPYRYFRVRLKQPYYSEAPVPPPTTVKCLDRIEPYHSEAPVPPPTAKNFDQIEIRNSPSPKKHNALDIVKDTSGPDCVIDITDLPSDDDDDDDTWINVEGKKLWNVDKEIILNGKWLWGTHLTVVQLLLKKDCTSINGLMDTSVLVHKDQTISNGSVQILHVDGNHWITISTIQCSEHDFDADVVVYDSLNPNLSHATKMHLAKLIKTTRKELIIKIAYIYS